MCIHLIDSKYQIKPGKQCLAVPDREGIMGWASRHVRLLDKLFTDVRSP